VAPLGVAEAALAYVPHAELDVVADADHDLPLTHSDAIADACRALLAGAPR
jgi:pimeloyl-ACP methyl ester carboxylesterase